MLLETLDMLGLLFGVMGAIGVGRLNRKGFLSFIVGSLCHGTLGYIQSNYGLMATCLIFICIDIYYYRKWKFNDPSSLS